MKIPRSIAVILWTNALFFTFGCGGSGQCEATYECQQGPPGQDGVCDPSMCQGPPGQDGKDGVCDPSMCQGSEPAGVVSCLSGYSRVGPEGARGSFCITQQQQEAEKFFDAKDVCWAQGTTTARPHVCTLDEWYIACTQGADVGQAIITNMADDDDEWLANPNGTTTGLVTGLSSCSSLNSIAATASRPYRCCYD